VSKINILLLGLFGLLATILLVLEKPWAADRFDAASAKRRTPLFAGFDVAKAAKVEIRQGKDAVDLVRGGAGWQVPTLANFRANEDAVARLLDRIHAMTKGDLVTDDKAQHQQYRVLEADAPRVVVRDPAGRVLADFFQGRLYFDATQGQQSPQKLSALDCYIRPNGSDEVYRVGDFTPLEPVRVSDWIPRNLYRFEVDAIQSMQLSGSDLADTLVLNRRPDGSWDFGTGGAGEKANREACETLVRSFAALYLEEVAGPYEASEAPKYGFDHPRLRIVAFLTGNTTEELTIGGDAPPDPNGGERVYATGGIAKNHVARVFKSSLEALKATKAQLMGMAPGGATEGQPGANQLSASQPNASQPAASQPAASQPASSQPASHPKENGNK
jgi:hypothetical protein